MALLNRKVDYALLILSHLHRTEGGSCARAAAQRLGLSRAYVANILKELCHHGFVASQRGIKGGYVLRRQAAQITLAQLMDALDDPFRLAECCRETPDGGCWLHGVCPIEGPIGEVHRRVREVLGKVTLAELFEPKAAPLELNVSRCRALQTTDN